MDDLYGKSIQCSGFSFGKAKWTLPGMLMPIFHWQWLCAFIVSQMNADVNGLHGGLIGDEMGLRKIT